MTAATGAVLAEPSPWLPVPWGASRVARRSSATPAVSFLAETRSAPEWQADTLKRVRNLRWLAPGWDGPGSPAMHRTTVDVACFLIDKLAESLPTLRPPTIVPTPEAGIFVEWYDPTCSIGFTVRHAGSVEVCYEDADRDIEWEGGIGKLQSGQAKRLAEHLTQNWIVPPTRPDAG